MALETSSTGSVEARGHGVAVVPMSCAAMPLPGGVEPFFDCLELGAQTIADAVSSPPGAALIVPMASSTRTCRPMAGLAQLRQSPQHLERWRKSTAPRTPPWETFHEDTRPVAVRRLTARVCLEPRRRAAAPSGDRRGT